MDFAVTGLNCSPRMFRGGMDETTVCEVLGCASAFHGTEAS